MGTKIVENFGAQVKSLRSTASGDLNTAFSEPLMPIPAWHEAVIQAFKDNNVRLIVYVPDNVLRPLIDAVHADDYFTAFAATREEEAVGIICGAAMAGLRGIVLMQTSGFATLANVLASLAVAAQIPALLMISERGTLGDFQIAQAIVCRTMRPVLESLGMEHHTMTRLDEAHFIADRTIKQAYKTQAPAALILSPLLTAQRASP
jgi:sulfopyruvate decarboxylase alpha subunit